MTQNPIFAGLAIVLLFAGASAQVKTIPPKPIEPKFADARQAIVVTTQGWNTLKGQARLFERKGSKWKQVGDPFLVVVGHNGLGIDSSESWLEGSAGPTKAEGDGRAPAGIIPLTFAFGKAKNPGDLDLPYTRLEEFTECVDDVTSNHYNTV